MLDSDELPYLFQLGSRLTNGLQSFDEQRKQCHQDFLLSQQTDEGGFRGREGDADLYYTGFAIRALDVIGKLNEEICQSISPFLLSKAGSTLNVIDLVSWIYSALMMQIAGGIDIVQNLPADWREKVSSMFEQTRTSDGGYAKALNGAKGSTYQSFLVSLTYQLIGMDLPNPNDLIRFVHDRQREDGGFVEIEPVKRSGTNPTAAAIGILQMFQAVNQEVCEDVGVFLKEILSSEGGFQANSRIEFADGLSTFTGLLTAQDISLTEGIDFEKMEYFVQHGLELSSGGFLGASWDTTPDVEYTFYGLGTLALLSNAK